MKKLFALILLCSMLLMSVGTLALADGVQPVDMLVVNCNEWVSLRDKPTTSSARLDKIPLGTLLEDCYQSIQNPDFYSCGYNGKWGYVHSDYLMPVSAEEAEPVYEDGDLGTMYVVNCEEWIPLREMPDAAASVLVQIPMGAVVYGARQYSPEFIYCEYRDVSGYIPAEYLTSNVLMLRKQLMERYGEMLRVFSLSDLTIYVWYGADSNGEFMLLLCCDAYDNVMWTRNVTTSYSTELQLLEAFIGGTEYDPLVMIYSAEEGLYAMHPYTANDMWHIAEPSLGAGLSYDVAEDGTMYIGGFYGPDPIAIDVNGSVLWQSAAGFDAFWLFDIEITDEGIVASYDNFNYDVGGQICYDPADGTVTWINPL